MQGIRLEPAHSLLRSFSVAELQKLARRGGIRAALPRTRPVLIDLITRHLDIDEIVGEVRRLFPAVRGRGDENARLDRLPPGHGDATVQAYSRARPDAGTLLLERGESCLAFDLNSVPLYLENRWPVLVVDAGKVPHRRLYAAFVKPGKIHASAEAPPPRTKPYLLDEGEYQLRHARLRLELAHAGPISFAVTFLRNRQPGGRPEYLLEPIT
jgi:hypothetical protein